MMRYQETGNIHKDFHLATNTTIKYVLKEYGPLFLKELFRRTAQGVFKDIYENLKRGELDPLLEHWEYYYKRERGEFEIIKSEDEVVFHVRDCPAVRHLTERGADFSEDIYLQVSLMNEAWSEGTPFEIATELIGEGEYKMIVRRKHSASE